jgi:hypothetical protein
MTDPMLTDAEIEFLRAALDEDEKIAGRAYRNGFPVNSGPLNGWWVKQGSNTAEPITLAAGTHAARHEPYRVLRDVAVWRRLLLDYQTAPLDAAYGGTERETGFRLALAAALKAKIATYDGNPVTGKPFPRRPGRDADA